ncbi:MAG: TetR/AcrR family transcriptional regulator, partial [Erythrobacter sp.]|uniref:TetR/AcrR family transcriptional regulator n=1 Tax=Erythrobacter sp. TaxID=1042 RepID=UPI0025D123BC
MLEAAAALFAERGFLGTSLADIAEASGVTKSNIFYFFTGKDELWKAAVDHVFDSLHSQVDTPGLRDFTPSWELFEAVLREHVLTCARQPAYIKIPLIEGSQHSWRTEWLAERHMKRSVAWFAAFLAPFVDAGMIPPG